MKKTGDNRNVTIGLLVEILGDAKELMGIDMLDVVIEVQNLLHDLNRHVTIGSQVWDDKKGIAEMTRNAEAIKAGAESVLDLIETYETYLEMGKV